jgi:hypothetical protein
MSAAAPGTVGEIETLRLQARLAHQVVRLNAEGITHEESVRPPGPAGNCLNWVVGHLVALYGRSLPLLGQEPVMAPGELARYDRGSEPLTDPAAALPLDRLLAAWDEASRRFDAGLAALAPETLDRPAPFSPGGDPDETVRSLLATVLFHQGYHSGQTGILRRTSGREGAIR